MTEIFTAKTVEEAKKLAAAKFGKNIKSIKFEVIEEARKGILGIGAKDAKVKAVYIEKPVSEVKKETNPVSEVKKETEPEVREVTEVKTESVEKIAEEEKKPSDAPETLSETQEYSTPAQSAETPENVAEALTEPSVDTVEKNTTETVASDEGDDDYSIDNFTLIDDEALMNPKVKLAMDYMTSIFRAIDIDAEFRVYQNETGAVINIESNNNGTIIGRRGETLDSIQYLCSIIANKGDKDYFRITIDCLGYRQKRKETLEQLAAKVAKSVLKTGRSQPLEPMNPYERRVIHSAISDIKGVVSHSVGEEPYRKII
ncbi:MAG: KH domain-containing protein, partial [Ruminococcus sp.]|nr:KH domain-containing protein [Ruminococcus sp.]